MLMSGVAFFELFSYSFFPWRQKNSGGITPPLHQPTSTQTTQTEGRDQSYLRILPLSSMH